MLNHKNKIVIIFICLIVCTWMFSACSKDGEIPQIYLKLPKEIAIGNEVNVFPKVKDNITDSSKIKITVRVYTNSEDIKINDYKFVIKYPVTYFIELEAEDEAGNISFILVSFRGVDITPPDIEYNPQDKIVVGERYFIKFNVMDNVSPSEKIKVYISIYLGNEEIKLLADDSFIPPKEGLYEITIRAFDECGNSNECLNKIRSVYKA